MGLVARLNGCKTLREAMREFEDHTVGLSLIKKQIDNYTDENNNYLTFIAVKADFSIVIFYSN